MEIRTQSSLRFSNLMRQTDEEQDHTAKISKWVGSFSRDHRPDETSLSSLASLYCSYLLKSTPKIQINQKKDKQRQKSNSNNRPTTKSPDEAKSSCFSMKNKQSRGYLRNPTEISTKLNKRWHLFYEKFRIQGISKDPVKGSTKLC